MAVIGRRVIALSALAVVALGLQRASAATDVEQTYTKKRDSARSAYEDRLYVLARTALTNGLGAEGMMFLREIVVRNPNHAKARDMARKLEEVLAKRAKLRPTTQQQRLIERRKKSMQMLADRERAKFVAKIVKTANWCGAQDYEAGLREMITDGLALDEDCVALRTLNGEKKHALYGWLESSVVVHMQAGEWHEDGDWRKWSGISARRIAAFKERTAGKLSDDFRFMASYHFTIASNLKDKAFEGDMLDSLELLVREQYREFYSDFRVGMKPHHVVYFETKDQFSKYANANKFGNADSMGFYSGRMRTLYVWRHSKTGTNGIGTAYHETTHGTLQDFFKGKRLPRWLNEGLASFHEKARPADKGFRFGPINIPRMAQLKKSLEGGKHYTIGAVFSLGSTWNKDMMFSYNLSAMWIHFLYSRKLLKPFLKEMVTHADTSRAVANVLGPDTSAWDKVFDAYLYEEILDPKAISKMRQQMKGTRLQ